MIIFLLECIPYFFRGMRDDSENLLFEKGLLPVVCCQFSCFHPRKLTPFIPTLLIFWYPNRINKKLYPWWIIAIYGKNGNRLPMSRWPGNQHRLNDVTHVDKLAERKSLWRYKRVTDLPQPPSTSSRTAGSVWLKWSADVGTFALTWSTSIHETAMIIKVAVGFNSVTMTLVGGYFINTIESPCDWFITIFQK